MHLLLSALILSLSSNLDTFAVAISYGLQKIKIPFLSNLIIAIITSIGTFVSMELGVILIKFLPLSFTDILGGILLILIGFWFLIDFFKNLKTDKNNGFEADTDHSGDISLKETIPLSLALTINNLGVGIAASITGVSIFYTTLFTFIITLLCISIGTSLGKSFLGKYSPLISSILLIILGLFESFF